MSISNKINYKKENKKKKENVKEKENEKKVFDLRFRNNSDYLGELRDRIQTVVPFVGAGASKAYGFPLWSEFIKEIIDVIENGLISLDPSRKCIDKMLSIASQACKLRGFSIPTWKMNRQAY